MRSIHILRDGKRVGIFQARDIRTLAAGGYFGEKDLAWAKGMPDWRPLAEVVPGVGRVPSWKRERRIRRIRIPFFSMVPFAFVYPFRSGGVGFLFGHGVLLLTAFFLGDAPDPGPAFMVMLLTLLGFLAIGYLPQVVHASAVGDEVPPAFPSMDREWSAFLFLYFLTATSLIVCFLPLGVYVANTGIALESSESFWRPLAYAGGFVAPMVILRAVVYRNIVDAVNPVQVAISIIKVILPYLVVIWIFLTSPKLAAWVWSGLETVPHPLRDAVTALFYYYLLLVGARLLGMIAHTQKQFLRWF